MSRQKGFEERANVKRKCEELGRGVVDAELLQMMFVYYPETGDFIRKVGRPGNGSSAGSKAGNFRKKDGYWQIWLNGRLWLSHRLAWLYMTGEHPINEIDHKNGVKWDNRWLNLRAAEHGQNQANSGPYKNNKSGYKGVHAFGDRWIASIKHNKKSTKLGVFDKAEDAYAAYIEAATRLHGEFARFK